MRTIVPSIRSLVGARPFARRSHNLLRASRGITIAALLLFIQGCRLIQIVPEGGTIVSDSGNHDCAADTTCIIDVPNGTVFSETFTADPAPGYEFLGWKKANKFICGGKTIPCVANANEVLTAYEVDMFLEPIFRIPLTDLLPQDTRAVFQTWPGQDGAMDTSVSGSPWATGPLQMLELYSAGMAIAANAERVLLAQLGSDTEQFILSARLDGSDVDTLLGTISTTATTAYQGFPRWDLDGTGLQLARMDSTTLAIGPQVALELALDTFAGVAPGIASGPLGPYTLILQTDHANQFLYGLPALYGSAPAPGSGDASLSQMDTFSGTFDLVAGVLDGNLGFHGPNAETYETRINTLLAGYDGPAVFSIPGFLLVNINGLSAADDILPLAKTLAHDMDVVDYTDAVIHGGNLPWLNFEVGGDPAAIFINFEFAGPTEIANFEAAHLPTGFSLVPFRMIEGDPLRYLMVLNIYQSSGGLVEGARAEWSVFVADPDTAEPRFLVIEAKAENISADSVTPGFLTPPEPVSYEELAGNLEAYVGIVDPNDVETTYFSASIPWPQDPNSHIPFDRFFMPANDFVFWGNAVADKTLYNSTATNRDAAVVPPGGFTITDNSQWTAFIDPTPVQAAVYLNNQEIVISPWINLDEPYLDVTPQLLQDLIDFKNTFYPLTVQNLARDAIRGEGIALTAQDVTDSVPTAHYHFPLTDPTGLLMEVAGAPGVYTAWALPLFDGDTPGHYVTLSVYLREDDACGIRAEWSTYVEGADNRPETLRLDHASADTCVDPITLVSVASEVSQGIAGSDLDTVLNTPFIQFDATVDLGLASTGLPSLDWLEARERVCSLNDICDEFYYDGQRVVIPAEKADNAATTLNTVVTPWDSYIDNSTVTVGVRQNTSFEIFNNWRNLRPFAAENPVP